MGWNVKGRAATLALLAAVAIGLTGCGSKAAMHRPAPAYDKIGFASYYAHKFHGQRTASGQRYNQNAMTAAHRFLPFGTRVTVIHLGNNRQVVVRINDRGPFVKGRIIDLSYAAAKKLGMLRDGVVKVRVVQRPSSAHR